MDPFRTKLGPGLDEGGEIYLTPLQPADLTQSYVDWFSDSRVTRFLEAKNITADDALMHLIDGFVRDAWYIYAIVKREDTKHLGNIKIGPISRKHQAADLSVFIGDVDSWGKGFASDAVYLATRVAFEQLGIRKLRAGVIDGNEGSRRLFERLGWRCEATLMDDLIHEGTIKNRILFGIVNANYVLSSSLSARNE